MNQHGAQGKKLIFNVFFPKFDTLSGRLFRVYRLAALLITGKMFFFMSVVFVKVTGIWSCYSGLNTAVFRLDVGLNTTVFRLNSERNTAVFRLDSGISIDVFRLDSRLNTANFRLYSGLKHCCVYTGQWT